MGTHRVLVRMQTPDSRLREPGDLVDYDGDPDWKREPLDPDARIFWHAEVARPEQVETENRRHNIASWFKEGESPLPPGASSERVKQDPPSGWQG